MYIRYTKFKSIQHCNQLSGEDKYISRSDLMSTIFFAQSRGELLCYSRSLKPWKGKYFCIWSPLPGPCCPDSISAIQAIVSQDDLGWVEAVCPPLSREEDEVCGDNPDPPEVLSGMVVVVVVVMMNVMVMLVVTKVRRR